MLAANVASLISAGQSVQATATATLSGGTSQDVTATCTNWQSDNTGVLTVSSTGLLTAQKSGSATLTATCQGVTARGAMTVALKGASTFTLTGTVTDGFSHGILPNIRVQIASGPNAGQSTMTDAGGSYSLGGLSSGTFTVSFSAVSYYTTTTSVTLAADTQLNTVLQRNPTAPVDGTYNYRLVISSPAWCLTNAHVAGTGCGFQPPNDWVNSDFSIDGQLTVQESGTNFQFVMPKAPGNGYSTFTFQRSGTQLVNGAIVASVPVSMRTTGGSAISLASMQASAFSGQTDNSGVFQGIFDGKMDIWKSGLPCDIDWVCPTSGFRWTLTPR